MENTAVFADLLHKTITNINVDRTLNEIRFQISDGSIYLLFHEQDCCEIVVIEDICGDLDDLINSPITLAEESTSFPHPESFTVKSLQGSFTWTFYKLATVKGYVTIRWFGESNGYYSESVQFIKLRN